MIIYPTLKKGATIGVTAPSSGVEPELHDMFKQAVSRNEKRGYPVMCGETIWTQDKAKSAAPDVRAKEFNDMMQDESIGIIIPPWGGELLIEIIDKLDFASFSYKWILGYSDTSVLLLATTLRTGMATAHGTNFVDLRGEFSDETTAMWEKVLATNEGGSITQHSSQKFQKQWDHENPSSEVFHLTEPTEWKSLSVDNTTLKGRLLGGCIDVIRHLIGTSFGNIREFQEKTINNEPILWYFENCDLKTTELRRTLVQMQLAGWFDNCSGIMFGRSTANDTVEGYEVLDVYHELGQELNIPIVYDTDCGHVPPQVTFVNGAYAAVEVKEGKGKIQQWFR
ncbi:LD-carboxypeptidase [Virgibacillus phasianinus]|uniref:LD-carboxypeptidase n=1 Tax=Virgibacillus phasianinus TaxID=2017483 RepID=A0A220U071_9BACI|nr:S66 peptidase family protein [Virgibacillus phasianinus]ASK61460.1 LD-carboxypeptidase [Virgibacillus phasianinus]